MTPEESISYMPSLGILHSALVMLSSLSSGLEALKRSQRSSAFERAMQFVGGFTILLRVGVRNVKGEVRDEQVDESAARGHEGFCLVRPSSGPA